MAIDPNTELVIEGVCINKKATDLRSVETIEDLEALEIFNQFDGPTAEAANESLFDQLPDFNGTFISPELSLAHTNGGSTVRVGTETFINSSIGAGTSGGALVLTPVVANWKTVSVNGLATKLLIKTNILVDDCAEDFNVASNGIACWYSSGYQTGSNSATSGTRAQINFGKTGIFGGGTGGVVASGPTNSPAEIGDMGTMYAEIDVTQGSASDRNIGLGGPFGPYYFIFAAQAGTNVDTKTYKFEYELQYD